MWVSFVGGFCEVYTVVLSLPGGLKERTNLKQIVLCGYCIRLEYSRMFATFTKPEHGSVWLESSKGENFAMYMYSMQG